MHRSMTPLVNVGGYGGNNYNGDGVCNVGDNGNGGDRVVIAVDSHGITKTELVNMLFYEKW